MANELIVWKPPTRWLCRIGRHRWRWVKAFHTTLVEADGKTWAGDQISYKGFVCEVCKERMIKKINSRPAPGITNEALTWYNEGKAL